MAKLTDAQWGDVQAAYVAGIEPVRGIAERFGVSHTAIQKRAKAEEWVRASGAKVVELVNAMAEARAAGLPSVSKLPAVATEIDRLTELKMRMERNAHLLADKLPEMLDGISTMKELQEASVAHKNLHDTHFKTAPDSQTNVQVNVSDRVKGFRVSSS